MFIIPIVEKCSRYTNSTLFRLEFNKYIIYNELSLMKVNGNIRGSGNVSWSNYINIRFQSGCPRLTGLVKLLINTGILCFGNSDILLYAKMADDNTTIGLVFVFYNKMVCFTMKEFERTYIFLLEGYNGDLLPCVMYKNDELRYGSDYDATMLYSFRTVSDEREKSNILRSLL